MRGDRRKILGCVVGLAVVAGACSGGGDEATEPAPTTTVAETTTTTTSTTSTTTTTVATTTTSEPSILDDLSWSIDFSPVELPAGVLSEDTLAFLGLTEADLLDPQLPPVAMNPIVFTKVVNELAASGYGVEFISQTTDIDQLTRGIDEGLLDVSPEFRALIDAYDATFDGTAANAISADGEALLDAKRDEFRAADAAGDVEALEALLAESETWEDQVESPSANFYATVRDLRLRIEQAIAQNR